MFPVKADGKQGNLYHENEINTPVFQLDCIFTAQNLSAGFIQFQFPGRHTYFAQ